MRNNRARALAALTALAFVASACGDDTTNPPTNTDTAQLRVIHASPDAPAVDLYAKGSATPLFTNVKYGDTTAFKSVSTGSVQVEIRAAGAAATSAAVFTTPALSLTKDAKVDAIAAGLLASTADADRFRVLALPEGFTAPASGKIRVRIVHAGADAPTVGLDVGNDGTVDAAGLARFADTGAAGVELPAGAELQVGVVNGTTPVTAFTLPALPAGTEAVVVATGLLSRRPREGSGFALLAAGVGFIKQNPRVYALHLSPDAPAVDAFLGTAKLIDDLAFGQLKGIQVPPVAASGYALDLFAHAAGSTRPGGNPAATIDSGELAAGEQYLVIADGFLAPPTGNANGFGAIKLQEGFELTDAAARVRLVHGSPDVPPVDIGTYTGDTMDSPRVVTNVPFKADSGAAGVSLPAATLPIGVAIAGQASPALKFSVTTAAGLRAFAIAGGSLNNVSGNGVKLYVVDAGISPWTVAAISPLP